MESHFLNCKVCLLLAHGVLISFLVVSALEKPTVEEDKQGEDNGQTIRPNRSPAASSIHLSKPPDISPIVEDYSDLVADEDEQSLQNKLADFKVGTR